METAWARSVVEGLLGQAGIRLGGDQPWDLHVQDERFFARVLSGGTLAAGETYLDGWWDVPRLDEFFARVHAAGLGRRFTRGVRARWQALYGRVRNLQTVERAKAVARRHYDLGNDLFQVMLGRRLCYTCAYWKGARSLDEADEAKLELVCRKIELGPGMTVLELGCGWGSFAKYAAEKYGARVVGYNISQEQVALGRRLCAGLPVELRQQDYRLARGVYDRVVSIGIMEHVGPKNYRAYMETAARCLKDDGIAFVHTIGGNVSATRCDPWFDKHIFPNGVTPSLSQLARAMEGLFVAEDCHNIGPHYDPTLMAWHENLSRGWPGLAQRYGERFFRMMRYYLLASAGTFRSRMSQLYQIVMTKPGRRQPACRWT